jgi:hypothetical protein
MYLSVDFFVLDKVVDYKILLTPGVRKNPVYSLDNHIKTTNVCHKYNKVKHEQVISIQCH